MRILLWHVDSINVEPKQKAVEEADEEAVFLKAENAVVAFVSVEDGDNDVIVEKACNEILSFFNLVKAKEIVVYPYVHLTSNPAKPSIAKSIINEICSSLEKTIKDVKKAPFGWYKAFEVKMKGHPLSELSREIKASGKEEKKAKEIETIIEESKSLKEEEKIKSEFFIMDTEGFIKRAEDYDYRNKENLRKLVSYEMKKSRVYESEPPHIKIMREQELVDYEEGSDSGNMRYYPKGRMIKKVLEKYVTDICLSYGAHEVETPIMYNFEHKALKQYLHRFPARQYIVLSDDKKFFLRFAACFGQFLIAHDATISYKNLPLRLYELTRYSFRREQSGELAGLKRLRAFTMPDMHTIVKDMQMAKEEFEKQLELSINFLKELELFDYTEVAFRVEKSFFDENIDWYKKLVKKINKDVMFEIFDKRYAYFITKFEFNFIDNLDKASALSTVQIDVENAERFDINYVDEDGKKKKPIILHASISGAIERVIYAILEKQAMLMKNNKKANMPLFISPIQVRVIPLSDKYVDYALEIADVIKESKIRVDVDDRNITLSAKIRNAEKEWIPYIVVIGEKERENKILSVTIREKNEKKEMKLEELLDELNKKIKIKESLNMPMLLTKRVAFIRG